MEDEEEEEEEEANPYSTYEDLEVEIDDSSSKVQTYGTSNRSVPYKRVF